MHAAGKVTAMTPVAKLPGWFDVVVDDGAEHHFGLYLASVKPPFAVGDSIDATLRRGGGWHVVYDALIKDHRGQTLLVVSGSGADDWADGWKVARGSVVGGRASAGADTAAQRTHVLEFTRGKARATVSTACTVLDDGTARYLASGFAISWLGPRPPDGVDYQAFSMVRSPARPRAAR